MKKQIDAGLETLKSCAVIARTNSGKRQAKLVETVKRVYTKIEEAAQIDYLTTTMLHPNASDLYAPMVNPLFYQQLVSLTLYAVYPINYTSMCCCRKLIPTAIICYIEMM